MQGIHIMLIFLDNSSWNSGYIYIVLLKIVAPSPKVNPFPFAPRFSIQLNRAYLYGYIKIFILLIISKNKDSMNFKVTDHCRNPVSYKFRICKQFNIHEISALAQIQVNLIIAENALIPYIKSYFYWLLISFFLMRLYVL